MSKVKPNFIFCDKCREKIELGAEVEVTELVFGGRGYYCKDCKSEQKALGEADSEDFWSNHDLEDYEF